MVATLLAQTSNTGISQIQRPSSVIITDLGVAFSNLINIGFFMAALIVFVFLILGGVQWITSGGDKAKTEAARSRITAAIVGLAIVAASWALMLVLKSVFGIDVFNPGAYLKPLNTGTTN